MSRKELRFVGTNEMEARVVSMTRDCVWSFVGDRQEAQNRDGATNESGQEI